MAGYGWKCQTKSDKTAYDIIFDGNGYRWNTHSTDWINSADAVNEIGCIHTVQGYDLNIAGVVFGPEITYDRVKKEIVIDHSNYHDQLGKTKDPKELKLFIQNIYITLMTRGIRGTKNTRKFTFGAVMSVNGLNYFVPVSSYSKKQEDVILIKDKKNTHVLGSLRFTYMIPVPEKCLVKVDINSFDSAKSKGHISDELAFCRRNRDKIFRKEKKNVGYQWWRIASTNN